MLKGVLFITCATPLFENLAKKKWVENNRQTAINESKYLTSHRYSRCV